MKQLHHAPSNAMCAICPLTVSNKFVFLFFFYSSVVFNVAKDLTRKQIIACLYFDVFLLSSEEVGLNKRVGQLQVNKQDNSLKITLAFCLQKIHE